jgi:hypothetical protein
LKGIFPLKFDKLYRKEDLIPAWAIPWRRVDIRNTAKAKGRYLVFFALMAIDWRASCMPRIFILIYPSNTASCGSTKLPADGHPVN